MNGPVGIVGAGYVGLPLAQVFAEAGRQVLLVEIDADRVDAINRGESYVKDVLRGTATACRSGHAERHLGLRPPPRGGGDPDRIADAAVSPARAGLDRARSSRSRRGSRRGSSSSWSRRPTPARRESACCRCWSPAASRRARTSTSRSRPSESTRAARTGPLRTRPRSSAASRPPARSAPFSSTRACSRASCRLLAGGRRADEAAGEHLSLGEHRARQRARAALRPDEHRRLGGRGRRSHEAVRVHELPAGAGPRRALHADRPLLPDLEGAGVRLLHGVHRAGGEGQREHAVVVPREGRAGAELSGARAQRLEGPCARRRLQGGHRRHPRVACAQADRALAGRGGQRLLSRPQRAQAPSTASPRRRSTSMEDCVVIVTATAASTTTTWSNAPSSWSTCGTPRARTALRTGRSGSCEHQDRPRGSRLLGGLARNFAELADLRWLCDLSPDLLAEHAARYPGARTTSDFEELLADPELDAVTIATPVVTHYDLAKQALQAGKHVFVEKPPAQSSSEAEELLALAEERSSSCPATSSCTTRPWPSSRS